jgi:carbonic anhydrase/acetyltransferase-like protein (isoleucine patch superfamily)
MTRLEFLDREPSIHPSAFIAPSADIIGDVTVGKESSVWYGCVLRADINRIKIGERSNIQDGSVLHLSDRFGVSVGDAVTIGHKALIHACTVGDGALIGMGAIVMDGAVIGANSIIGAGSLVLGGTEVPPGSLVIGSPARVVRRLTPEECLEGRRLAEKYVMVSRRYLARGRPS